MARHGGVAPIYLLDVLDFNGYSYHWSTESIPSAAALGISAHLHRNAATMERRAPADQSLTTGTTPI